MQEPKRARIILRTDSELKEEAQATFEEMGLSLSQGIQLYLREVVATGKIPFEIQTKAARIAAEADEAEVQVREGKRQAYTVAEYKNYLKRLEEESTHE